MDLLILSDLFNERDIVNLFKEKKYDSVILSNGFRHEKISSSLSEKLGCEVIYLTALTLNRQIDTSNIKRCGKGRLLLLLNYYRVNYKEVNDEQTLVEKSNLLKQSNFKTIDNCFTESNIVKVKKKEGDLYHYILYTYNKGGKPSINVKGNVIKINHFLTGNQKIYAELGYNSITIKNMNKDVLEKYTME